MQILVEVPFLLLFRSEDLQSCNMVSVLKQKMSCAKVCQVPRLNSPLFLHSGSLWGSQHVHQKRMLRHPIGMPNLFSAPCLLELATVPLRVVPTDFTWAPWRQKSYKQHCSGGNIIASKILDSSKFLNTLYSRRLAFSGSWQASELD